MSPAPLNKPTTWKRVDELATRRRQARRRAVKKCILGERHGAAYRGNRCRRCYLKMLAAKRVGSRGKQLTIEAYIRVRDLVVARMAPAQRLDTQLVVERTEASLRRWYDVPDGPDCSIRRWAAALAVNVAPPGWTPEQDRREELLDISYDYVMRKVS